MRGGASKNKEQLEGIHSREVVRDQFSLATARNSEVYPRTRLGGHCSSTWLRMGGALVVRSGISAIIK